MDVTKKYNQDYYTWYKKIGEYGAIFNKHKFDRFIDNDDVVLDFGCGGGYLLDAINCKEKFGVEINPVAIEEAGKKFKIFKSSQELQKNFFNKIISNQVLQHCENPRKELMYLYKSLKPEGKIIVIVACSGIELDYKEGDINFQLYSWSPMNLGNLLKSCGYEVIQIKKIISKWPPKYEYFHKFFGIKFFNIISYLYGYLNKNKISQCIAIAKK